MKQHKCMWVYLCCFFVVMWKIKWFLMVILFWQAWLRYSSIVALFPRLCNEGWDFILWTFIQASSRDIRVSYNSLVCYKSDITQNALFSRRSFWKFNFLAITEEREIYLIISISKQRMESCQFPSTYTAIFGLLDDVNN